LPMGLQGPTKRSGSRTGEFCGWLFRFSVAAALWAAWVKTMPRISPRFA
jgi:hypothetical protein